MSRDLGCEADTGTERSAWFVGSPGSLCVTNADLCPAVRLASASVWQYSDGRVFLFKQILLCMSLKQQTHKSCSFICTNPFSGGQMLKSAWFLSRKMMYFLIPELQRTLWRVTVSAKEDVGSLSIHLNSCHNIKWIQMNKTLSFVLFSQL